MQRIEEIIKKINKFSKIAKERELTIKEKTQREALRNEYRSIFKAGFEQRLQNIKFFDEEKDNQND